jgi:hypothetical protein
MEITEKKLKDLLGNNVTFLNKAWTHLMVLLILYCAIEIPMDLLFNFEGKWLKGFNFLLNTLFIFDLFINILQIKKANSQEKKEYYSFWFWIDLLSATPFEIVAFFYPPAYEFHFLSFFKVFRIIRVIKLFSTLSNLGKIKPSQITYQRLLNFAILSSLAAHWIALLWIWVGGVSREQGDTTAYINGLYWTITTLTTIGYGDITPQTNEQKIFTMFIMAIGVGIYGYIIGNFTSLLSNVDYVKMNFLEKIEKINTFLNYKKVPAELRESIYNYYNFLWDKRRGFDENSVMNELPYSLRMKVALYLNKNIIEKISIFQGASEEIISEIVLKLKPEIYMPSDFIFKEGDTGDKMFFISFGSVAIINEKTKKVITTMNQGDYFGEFALLDSGKRTASVQCLDYCDLYSLDRECFTEVITNHPEFADKIQKLAADRKKNK